MKIANWITIASFAFIIFLLPTISLSQDKPNTIGKIGEKVILKNDGENYIIRYQNNNEYSDGETNEFIIEDKMTLNKFYDLLIDGFESMNPGPIQFELDEGNIRLYYIKRMGLNKVEIIHENKETEETGTLPRLRKKDINKLFGRD